MSKYSVYATFAIAALVLGACELDKRFSAQRFTIVPVGDMAVQMETTTGDIWILHLGKINHPTDDSPKWQHIPRPIEVVSDLPALEPPEGINVENIDYQIVEDRFKIEHARIIRQSRKISSYIVLDLIASQDMTERLTENLQAGFFNSDSHLLTVCPVHLEKNYPLKKGEKITASISCLGQQGTPEKWSKLSLRKEI